MVQQKSRRVANLEEAKAKALAKVEKMETHLKEVLAKIQANTEKKPELKEKMAAGIQKTLEKLAAVKVQIQKATTREELIKGRHDVRKGIHMRAKNIRHNIKENVKEKRQDIRKKMLHRFDLKKIERKESVKEQ